MLSITMLPCSIGGNCLLALHEDDCSATSAPATPLVNTTPATRLDDQTTMNSVTNSRTDSVTLSAAAVGRRSPKRMAAGILWHMERSTVCRARFGAGA